MSQKSRVASVVLAAALITALPGFAQGARTTQAPRTWQSVLGETADRWLGGLRWLQIGSGTASPRATAGGPTPTGVVWAAGGCHWDPYGGCIPGTATTTTVDGH